MDHDGEEVEHGYYFDEIGFVEDAWIYMSFDGGNFPYDLSRRKVSFDPAVPEQKGGSESWSTAEMKLIDRYIDYGITSTNPEGFSRGHKMRVLEMNETI